MFDHFYSNCIYSESCSQSVVARGKSQYKEEGCAGEHRHCVCIHLQFSAPDLSFPRQSQAASHDVHPANLAFMSDIDLALCLFFTIKLSQAFWALLFHINDTSQKTPACSHFTFCLFCGPLSSKPFIPQRKYIQSSGNIL